MEVLSLKLLQIKALAEGVLYSTPYDGSAERVTFFKRQAWGI